MRTIDADALKELFSEVIGHIAKKPEMNGNLEHMIRASAMVIQMIDDAPTVQPDTTTYDSIPVETGKNDGDGTSGDLISRTQAIDEIHEDAEWLASQGSDWQTERMERDKSILMSLPSVQPETNCSEFPNNWIPCSERLPKESRKYLVTVLDGVGKRTTSALYHRRSKSWTLTGRMAYWKVIAWMPLPEYYLGGGEAE